MDRFRVQCFAACHSWSGSTASSCSSRARAQEKYLFIRFAMRPTNKRTNECTLCNGINVESIGHDRTSKRNILCVGGTRGMTFQLSGIEKQPQVDNNDADDGGGGGGGVVLCWRLLLLLLLPMEKTKTTQNAVGSAAMQEEFVKCEKIGSAVFSQRATNYEHWLRKHCNYCENEFFRIILL